MSIATEVGSWNIDSPAERYSKQSEKDYWDLSSKVQVDCESQWDSSFGAVYQGATQVSFSLPQKASTDLFSHDLDHIDSIKRNSGVRSLVLDPFFNSWEPASIMAYLRDPTHWVNGRDMLNEAGGKFLERREIMNIFSQNLRKIYPGLDISVVKKEQEKYKQVKMCNFKGCNQAFPDAKALAAHRKIAHAEKRHDHSHRIYTCPEKGCHRKKKSKGFMTLIAMREHQVKSQHFGTGLFHGDEGPTECLPITDADTLDGLRAEEDLQDQEAALGAIEGDAVQALSNLPQAVNMQSSLSFNSRPEHSSEMRLVSSLLSHSSHDPSFLAIDPAMQNQRTAAQAASALETMSEALGGFGNDKNALIARFEALQREDEALQREEQALQEEREARQREMQTVKAMLNTN
jgi:hypothetical protein